MDSDSDSDPRFFPTLKKERSARSGRHVHALYADDMRSYRETLSVSFRDILAIDTRAFQDPGTRARVASFSPVFSAPTRPPRIELKPADVDFINEKYRQTVAGPNDVDAALGWYPRIVRHFGDALGGRDRLPAIWVMLSHVFVHYVAATFPRHAEFRELVFGNLTEAPPAFWAMIAIARTFRNGSDNESRAYRNATNVLLQLLNAETRYRDWFLECDGIAALIEIGDSSADVMNKLLFELVRNREPRIREVIGTSYGLMLRVCNSLSPTNHIAGMIVVFTIPKHGVRTPVTLTSNLARLSEIMITGYGLPASMRAVQTLFRLIVFEDNAIFDGAVVPVPLVSRLCGEIDAMKNACIILEHATPEPCADMCMCAKPGNGPVLPPKSDIPVDTLLLKYTTAFARECLIFPGAMDKFVAWHGLRSLVSIVGGDERIAMDDRSTIVLDALRAFATALDFEHVSNERLVGDGVVRVARKLIRRKAEGADFPEKITEEIERFPALLAKRGL